MVKYFLFGFFLCARAVSAQQLVDKVAGIVDNKMVLWSDVEAQYQQMNYGQSNNKYPPSAKCGIMNDLLTQKLLLAQAAIDSVTVTDDDVESDLDKRIRNFASMAGSMDKLEAYYGKSIVELKDQFRPQIRDILISQKEKDNIIKDVKVTPSDVESYFTRLPKDSLPYYNQTIQIGEVVVYAKVSDEVKSYYLQKAEDLLKRVKNGEDFASLAAAYSDDPGSADKGGELGFMDRGELDPSFEAAAFALKKPNDVSDVVESSFGYHIIQLIERRGDRINVRHILIKPKVTSSDIQRGNHYADSIHDLIEAGKINFEGAVNKFSEDDNTKNSAGMVLNPKSQDDDFDMSDLGDYDQRLVPIIDTLRVGEISAPTSFRDDKSDLGYRIIYLRSKTQPHQANLKDDYDKIEANALVQKQADVVNKWLMDRIAKTYIYLAPDFANCKELSLWNKGQQ